MKINPFNNPNINPYNRQQKKAELAEQQKNRVSDKVEISSAAKEMQDGSRIQMERQARIDQLKVDVESGNYKVDSKKVAEDLFKHYRG
ncbi:flagellar biosynthesis anti-sigma factor FlgM [Jeotgalibacillus soli]|uniref:Negative regulator of flagellin synthesis n=1 Tax=Jeotgalibacillus soli TaxID=889306 RepID=A0A0C2VZW5_9BACL|nr:flagellar biosynthesis anti-sigma factor FlgM [Jeotgalibacillus soli]KIL49911.1 anti-sigma-28 factor FlgM [Jeotgalibacillus soli]